MRIISDFRDYYDKVQGLGQDRETTWIRKAEDVPDRYNSGREELPIGKARVRMGRIGFCGKLYPLLIVSVEGKSEEVRSHYYSQDSYEVWLKTHLSKKEMEAYESGWIRKPEGGRRRCVNYPFPKKEVEQFFSGKVQKWLFGEVSMYEFEGVEPIIISVGKVVEEPIKTVGGYDTRNVMTINGRLNEYEFFKVVDPYTAFQSLYAWRCNMAFPNKPIPEVSDKDMIIAKGFDPKWSFRKPPKDER